MAKTKSDVNAKAMKSVATNAMFNKVGKEGVRQEKSRHVKDASGKSTKTSKGSKESKSKPKAKRIPEHPLEADFSYSIEDSRETIKEQALTALDKTYRNLSEHLVESYDFINQREQDLINVTDAIGNPLDEQELEWTSTDGKQSGKTMLGVRMKKLQRTIEAEERESQQQFDAWTNVQTEFRQVASQILGPDGLDNLLAGNFDPYSFVNLEREGMKLEIEAQQKAFMQQIEEAGQEAMEAMTESEKKLELQQKKKQNFFMAILRDEE